MMTSTIVNTYISVYAMRKIRTPTLQFFCKTKRLHSRYHPAVQMERVFSKVIFAPHFVTLNVISQYFAQKELITTGTSGFTC